MRKKMFERSPARKDPATKEDRDIPLSIYISFVLVFLFVGLMWFVFRDLALNLIAEFIGALWIIFVIDRLVRRDKRLKWLIVKDETEYLLSRTINRLRQHVLEDVFSSAPSCAPTSREDFERIVREGRERKLRELSALGDGELLALINKRLFHGEFNEYFHERSEELWKYLNMKYAEYLSPEVVQNVIELHVLIQDLCSHVRNYMKSDACGDKAAYYRRSGETGAVYCIKNIIRILIELKRLGYSETPKTELRMNGS